MLTRDEIEFPFSGDVELEDLESKHHVLAGAATAQDYRRAFGEFLERWRTRCVSNGIDYTRSSPTCRLTRRCADTCFDAARVLAMIAWLKPAALWGLALIAGRC